MSLTKTRTLEGFITIEEVIDPYMDAPQYITKIEFSGHKPIIDISIGNRILDILLDL